MRAPRRIPFGFEALLVLIEDAQERLRFQFPECAIAEMMNEAILGGKNTVARFSDPEREIVVLEHADLEVHIEAADFVP